MENRRRAFTAFIKCRISAGKFRAGHFLRIDENRKTRMKSLWYSGYAVDVIEMY